MSPLSCELCGGRDATLHVRVAPATFSSRIDRFDVLRCVQCGLATMSPYPTRDDLRELYVERGLFSEVHDNPNRGRLGFRRLEPLYARYGAYYLFVARRCLRLHREANPPRVLDVGCSTGRLLSAFSELEPSAELVGLDVDPRAKERAPEGLRDAIVVGSLEDLPVGGLFDIITLCFVIEHVAEMLPPLRRAVELLAPGGVLMVSTPDLDSPKARQQGARWRLIDDPVSPVGHVRWFGRDTLDRLGAELGLRTERITRRGEVLYHLPRPAQSLLRRTLGTVEMPTGRRFIRNYQLRLLWATLLDGPASGWLGWGDCLYGFFRKPGGA